MDLMQVTQDIRIFHDAPEVVPAQPGLEHVTHSTLEAAPQASSKSWQRQWQKLNTAYSLLETHPGQFASLEHFKPESAGPNSPTEQTPALAGPRDVAHESSQVDRRPFWRRKRYWIIGCVVALVVVGVILRVVLGVVKKKKTSNTRIAGSCSGANTFCPQILAIPKYDGPLNVFARGADNYIWYRQSPDSESTTWSKIGGVEFLSQPTSITWNDGQVQVTAISSDKSVGHNADLGNVFTTWLRPNETQTVDQPWYKLGEKAAGSVGLCATPRSTWLNHVQGATTSIPYPDRIDAWVVDADSRNIVHDFWEPENSVWRSPEHSIGWDSEPSGNQIVGSAPGVVCRDDDHMHDIVAYTTAGVPLHRSYSNVTGNWSNWTTISDTIKFVGDPVVLQFDHDPTRFDFFGLDTDHRLWRMIWIANETGYSRIGKLNGPVVNSMPSVMATGDRVDLVATGADDKIYHLALVDSDFGSDADWEVVGDFANSAPVVAALSCDDGRSCTGIIALGEMEEGGSSLMFAHWETTSDTRWQSHAKEWKNVGGNLTAQYMVV